MDTIITSDQLEELLNNHHRIHILDVREPEEFIQGHIPSAVLIPLDQLTDNPIIDYWEANDPIVVVCRSGNRSARAQHYLKSIGFTNVKNLKGGMGKWRGPIIKESGGITGERLEFQK